MLLYAETISPRLRYITDFASREMGMEAWTLTTDRDEFLKYNGPGISYTRERIGMEALWIRPHGLLSETGIKPQSLSCFIFRDCKAFFNTGGEFPFDVFAAAFYLLSRYEEWLPYARDLYGRFPHEQSVAWKEGFLDIPVVNYWFLYLGEELAKRYPQIKTRRAVFTYLPTYDIDEAYCYKHKGWARTWGGALKDILKGKWSEFRLRRNVTHGRAADPFDAFSRMHEINNAFGLKPLYFFLVAEHTGRYDRHNLPSHPAMSALIKDHAARYRIGIHPSWQSGNEAPLLEQEIKTLERIAEIKLIASRQHFLRFTLPETYRRIAETGITEEYSMGYGTVNGFRAGVASPFFWYDLEREQVSHLLVYPFCYMEANSFYEQKQTPAAALNEMRHYYNVIRRVDGVLITIWHNTFLGSSEKFKGWREVYEMFLKEVILP